MKFSLRTLLATGLALLATAAAHAAAVVNVTGVSTSSGTSSPASVAPGQVVTFSVAVANGGAASPADDLPIGTTATATITVTNTVTNYTFQVTGTVTSTSLIAGAGGAGAMTMSATIPSQTTEAGSYTALVVLSGLSSGTLGTPTAAATGNFLSITGTPDLEITALSYAAGTSYSGGDIVPMSISYRNKARSTGATANNVPWVPSTTGNGTYFRIQIVLSSNPVYGDADDFRLTFTERSTKLNADDSVQTFAWNQLIPGNFSGSYYVLAKIDSLDGNAETTENDLTQNGNNIWLDVNAPRISIQPTNFATNYLASTTGTASGNGYSDNPATSADGRYTVFASDASNLVAGDTNGTRDIFIFDNQTSTTRRLNLSRQGTQANGPSNRPSITADGRYVTFESTATNLILGDTNGFSDIFVVDTITGSISLLSVESSGIQGNNSSFRPSVSSTGRYVSFESTATNLVSPATVFGISHIYVRDRDVSGSGTFDTAGNTSTVLVSQSTAGVAGTGNSLQSVISADGRYIAFASDASNLVAGDSNALRDIFVRDRTGAATARVSVATAGAQATGGASRTPSISADGRYIAYASEATNLVAGDTNAVSDIFVHDRTTTTTVRVSVSTAGTQAVDPSGAGFQLGSINPSISSTGRYVAFASLASNLTAGDNVGQSQAADSNASLDIFVRDRDVNASGNFDTGGNVATTLVSVNKFGMQTIRVLGQQSTASADIFPSISADGRWVVYPSDAEGASGLSHTVTNLISVDSNNARDVFLFDRRTNALPGGSIAPLVTITSPGTTTSILVNTAIPITASATTTIGVVSSVQFFVNGTSLGSSAAFPYTQTWTPTAVGTYVLSALVTDSFGNLGVSSNISVTVNAAPSVGVTSPVSGTSLTAGVAQTVTATAAATTPSATITSVQFFANGVSLGTDTTSPYSAPWTPASAGIFSLTAIATDSVGTQTTSPAVSITVIAAGGGANQLPTITVTVPASGASVGVGSVNSVTATAADADGTLTNVQFFANGVSIGTDSTFPYSTTWAPTVAGTYAITAVATDNAGGSATSSTNVVTVTNGSAPTVTVTAPSTGSAVAVNSTYTVTATAAATAPGATITSVQFFANGVSLGTDSVFPYTSTWTPSALGTYSITAVATDSTGNQATSTANSVTVSFAGPAPTVSLTSPNSGAAYVVGQPVTMGATVGLGSSFITGVQFYVNNINIGGGATPPNGQGSIPFWTASWTPAAPGSYTFTAIVTDAAGVQVTSAPVTITVSAVTTPTIIIASPSNATSFAPNIQQSLVATVGVTNASVLNVQFFANNVSLGTVTSFPYTVNWTPATTGSYSVIAVLTTSVGTTVTSAPVVYSVASGTLPTVTLNSPASVNVGFAQNITAIAAATQSGAVIRDIQFFVNGVSIGTDSTFPFSTSWTPVVPGSYSLTAVATDTLGNRQTSAAVSVAGVAVSAGAPTISIVTPINNATVQIGTSPAPVISITANANDADGTIASVQFFANGVSLGTITAFPYTIAWTPISVGTYALTAVAIDNGGNQSTSAVINVTASAAGAPTVNVTTSAVSNTSTVNSPVTLSANATAAFGRTVASVQFFANGTAVGAADTAFPYSTIWTPTAPGTYAITATATDDIAVSGSSASVTITITAGSPPVVSVTSPGTGATMAVGSPQTFTATATATAPATIASVQFLVNGVSAGTDTTSPYSVTYTPASLGAYSLTAVATDTLGNVTTSTAVNFNVIAALGPTVSITAPVSGTSGPIGSAVTVTATPTSGSVASVQFFANGVSIGSVSSAPYSLSWIPIAGGPVSLTAIATDTANVAGASSASVVFNVLTPAANIAITGPTSGSTIAVNTPQTITANASVVNGTVTSVQFFVNGVSIGTDTSFPYSISWTPTTAGSFAITATATDNFGTLTSTATTSGVVTVTVTGGTGPTVTITNPATGSTMLTGSSTTIVASATAASGTIANVEFLANGLSLGNDTAFPYNQVFTPTATGVYALTARATDTLGNVTTSPSVVVTVNAASIGAPIVSIIAPLSGASLPVNVATTVIANASDPDGNIASVQFFANGTSIGSSSAYPFRATFTPTAPGIYVLTALATDNGGNITTSGAVSISVSGGASPSVAISSPTSGSTVGVNALQTITANATAPGGFVASVQFLVNGVSLSSKTSFPYSASWTPTATGTYTLAARVTDNIGNIADSANVTVVVGTSTPPTVAITNPATGSSYTVGASLNITANASDSDGTITQVAFVVNGVVLGTDIASPYSAAWTPSSTGVYTVSAQATDNNGNITTSTAVTVTIGANAAPTVALTSPSAGLNFSLGNNVLIGAAANDSDGTVTSVQFFANGLAIGSASSAPYGMSWKPTSAGTFALTAVATDNVGNTTTSTSVSVSVTGAAAPTVSITNPVNGATFGVGTTIPLNAITSGGNGPISQVQFFVNGASLATDSVAPYNTTWSPAAAGTYSLLAVATDNAGVSGTSTAVTIVISSNGAPSVTLVSPGTNLTVGLGTTVNLSATASDSDGTITSVRFLSNGTALATSATAPYTTKFTPTAAGVYIIVAQATDNSGNVADSVAQTITVLGGNVPIVTLQNPSADTTISADSSLLISASAAISSGTISRVEFYVGTTLLSTKTAEPYSYVWRPSAMGSYAIRAVAYAAGSSTGVSSSASTVTVNAANAAPGAFYANITNPLAGSTLIAFRNLTISAVTNIGEGASPAIDFYYNGRLLQTVSAPPFQYTFNFTVPGTFEFHAVARINGAAYTSTPVSVTVLANAPPVVSLTAPSSGSTINVGSAVTIKATATDPDDLIDNVKFLVNGQILSTSSAFPYTATWTPTSEGIYTLTAIAKDSQGSVGGNQTSSSAIYVRVTAPASAGGTGTAPDNVYAGTYAGGSEFGKFAVVSVAGKNAAFIAYSTTGAAKTYFYSNLAVDLSGSFSSGTAVSGRINDTGVSGNMDSNRLTFIGPITFASAAKVPSGYYTGNIANRPASTVAGIVGGDGSIMVYVSDGSFSDAGSGAVDAAGNFSLNLVGGSKLVGKADPVTGFLTATLTGGPGGSVIAALASGGGFSDGSLRNLSSRGQVGTGSNILIAGFVVGGTTSKQVLVRAIGPTLANFGITGALTDSQLEIYSGSTLIASNLNWAGNPAIVAASATVGAFPLAANSLDAVVLAQLNPGAYTAQVSGTGGKTGVGLVELYDVDTVSAFSPLKVMNVSTRGVVGTGENILIAGFVVNGSTSKKLLIRGIGPALAPLGVAGSLSDPVLQIIRTEQGVRTVVRENDNWETGNDASLVSAAATKVGAFPLASGSKDAVILINLPPGTYSATVGGVGGATGVGMVEVYEVP